MCIVKKGLWVLGLTALSSAAFAADDIATIAGNITGQLGSLTVLLVVAAYVAGVGFALMGVTQFKAHKDNPQQTPISKPIVYIIIAAALLFLPTLMGAAGESVFGSTKTSGESVIDETIVTIGG